MSGVPQARPGHIPTRDHQHVGRISTATTFFVLTAVALLLYEIKWVLPPFVFAALLAYICTPPLEWLTARSGLPRALIACLIFIGLLAIGAVVGFLGIPPLVRELTHVATDFEDIVRDLAINLLGQQKISLFGQQTDANALTTAIVGAVRDWGGQSGTLVAVGGIAFVSLFGLILTTVLLCYFLLTGPRLARAALWLVPPKQRPLISRIWSSLDPVLKRYFVGVLVVVAYAATAAYLGLGFFLHIPHAVVLALLTGFLEMIPMVGPGASAALAGLVAVHYATGIGPIIGYALYATALRLSIDQVFGPLALGAAARLPPALIILCFLAGGLLFGIVGVIMAVPVALVVKVTLTILYDEPQQGPARS